MKRREFINKCSQLGIGLAGLTAVAGCSRGQPPGVTSRQVPSTTVEEAQSEALPLPEAGLKIGNNRWQAGPEDVDVAVAEDMTPAELVQAALDRYGGISSWVRRGDVVAIKPNLAWARQPAQAATTSPEVLAAVIKICQQAHPKRNIVLEHSCDTSTVAFDISGAKQVCRELSVPLIGLSHENMYQQVSLPAGRNIHTDQVATDILECDVYINLPIVKSHSGTVTTVTLKNQMGAVWDRGAYHQAGAGSARGLNLHQNIAGLAASLRPTLNIVGHPHAGYGWSPGAWQGRRAQYGAGQRGYGGGGRVRGYASGAESRKIFLTLAWQQKLAWASLTCQQSRWQLPRQRY